MFLRRYERRSGGRRRTYWALVESVRTDRLYGGLDWLLPHKPAIEKHLKDRLGSLFGLEYDLLLYDITSTYFEGECKANPLARRGYSRDSRPDCPQVCIGLVVTTDGIPLGYEVFAGNRNDYGSPGNGIVAGATGPRFRKAATCCEPISTRRIRSRSGSATSS